MGDSTTTPLSEVKRYDVLGLPRDVMKYVGPATQTFAALRAFGSTTGQTFASVRVIAQKACLQERTVTNHLHTLIKEKVVKRKGRERRRTVTYTMDLFYVQNNSRAKFAMLPRWAAMLLPTWAERVVFALVVSRDRLCLAIDDGPGGNGSDDRDEQGHAAAYERREYAVTTLAKHSGLSRRAVDMAKARLVERGILRIEPAVWWRDDSGRCRTMADTLLLNPGFPVPNELIHRSAKVSECEGLAIPFHRGAEVSPEVRKSFVDPAQIFPTPSAKVSVAVNPILNPIIKPSIKPTSASADAFQFLNVGEEEKTTRQEGTRKFAHINIEDRQKELAAKLLAMAKENDGVPW